MTDRTSSRKEVTPANGIKLVYAETGLTVVGATDTITVTLADYGISTLLAVHGYRHDTDREVIVEDLGTTSVTTGVLTYVTETGNDDDRRCITVYGE